MKHPAPNQSARKNSPSWLTRQTRIRLAVCALLLQLPWLAGSVMAAEFAQVGRIQREVAELDALIAPGTPIEQLTEARFRWSEGPVWIPGGDYVLFSDVPNNIAWKWSETSGLEVFLDPSGGAGEDTDGFREPGSNGLKLAPDGALLLADHGGRAIARVDLATRARSVVIDRFEGRRFNSPNDLVVSRVRWKGTMFFTDPPYGLKDEDKSPLKELPYNGVYRLDPDGSVHLLDGSLPRPNGIALSPDERYLYVANSQAERPEWSAYLLDDAGEVRAGPVRFATAERFVEQGLPGLPDGLAVDVDGNLWASGPGGIHVMNARGRLLGRIDTGSAVANCAFGGPDGSMLYITSGAFLARVQTQTRGLGYE